MTADTLTPASTKKPLIFWVLSGVCTVFAIGFFALLFLFFTSSEDETLRLLAEGQRLTIDTKTKEVSGNPRSTTAKTEDNAEGTAETPKTAEPVPSIPAGFDVAGEDEPIAAGTSEEETANADVTSSLVAQESDIETSIRTYGPSAASLKPPAADLGEPSKHGTLPKIGKEGSPARYYARPFSEGKKPKPVIAIMVVGLGQNSALTDTALNLPADISLSFSMHAKDTPLYLESARNLGHEAWLDFALQPRDFPASDPGPNALLSKAKPEELETQLMIQLARAVGYVGFVMPENESFSDDNMGFLTMTKTLKDRGVALLASSPPINTAAGGYIRSNPEVAKVADTIIDETLNEAAILAKLTALEERAQKNGSASAIARSYPVTLRTLETWSKSLAKKGIALAPVSSLYVLK